MFDREMKASLLEAIHYHPIVTIMGPRQAGKTTLAKQCFPDKSYINLESPDIRHSALDDPRGFLA